MIATQNTSASLYSILTYQIKFPLSPLLNFQKYFNPRVYSNPCLLSSEEFSKPPVYSYPLSIGNSWVIYIEVSTLLLHKQHFHKQHQSEICRKQKLSNTLRLKISKKQMCLFHGLF